MDFEEALERFAKIKGSDLKEGTKAPDSTLGEKKASSKDATKKR